MIPIQYVNLKYSHNNNFILTRYKVKFILLPPQKEPCYGTVLNLFRYARRKKTQTQRNFHPELPHKYIVPDVLSRHRN